jgi:hypothetical protein
MPVDPKQVLEYHARLREGWRKQLEMLVAGTLSTRSKVAGEEWKDSTAQTVHFIRGQISILDALDRLLQRP